MNQDVDYGKLIRAEWQLFEQGDFLVKWHYDFKSTFVIITLLFILTIPLTIISMFLSRPALLVLDTDRDGRGNFTLSVESSGRPVPIALDRTVQEGLRQKERGITFHVRDGWQKAGTVFLTLRQIENKDIIYFLDYEPRQPGLNLRLMITANEADSEINAHQIEYPHKINNTSSRWGNYRLTAQNTPTRLPNSPLILDSQTHYLRLGPAEVFKPLTNGVRLWLPEESGTVFMSRITPNHTRFTFDIPELPGTFTETWGILSTDPLINWHDPKADAAALTADLASYRKLAKDGFYYLTPTNYNPTAESAFWLNPAYHVGELFRRQKGRYFSDISITSMYSALNTQAEGGFWLTSPSSDWLNSEYGLAEGFFDTRFSTDAAIFLLHMYQQTGEKKALTAAARFAAALRAYTVDHGIPTAGGGVLVPDYFKPGTKHSQTHVSLNHLVTEMNFLYEMFLENRNPADLKVANQIRQSVRDTGAKWIRENGDLHYAYLPDGSFGMQDYPLLTLKDLRLSQQLIYKLTGREDEIFALLIKAKEDYLKKNNLPTK